MARLDGSYWDSHKEFLIGLLLAGLGSMLFFTIGSTDVRYSLKGLREVHGRVIQAESHKPGRHSSYHLVVTLETANGPLRLSQQATGYYAQRLAPGQDIRAWVDPEGDGATLPASHAVWQIERGSQVVMPVMEVGDRVLNRLLWDAGSALIPLLGGLFLIGRHLVRYHDDGHKGEEEAKTA
jgi:hypothetical protein